METRVQTRWSGRGRGSQARGADRRAGGRAGDAGAGLGTRAALAGPRVEGNRGTSAPGAAQPGNSPQPPPSPPRTQPSADVTSLSRRSVRRVRVRGERAQTLPPGCAGALRRPAPDTWESEGSPCSPPRAAVLPLPGATHNRGVSRPPVLAVPAVRARGALPALAPQVPAWRRPPHPRTVRIELSWLVEDPFCLVFGFSFLFCLFLWCVEINEDQPQTQRHFIQSLPSPRLHFGRDSKAGRGVGGADGGRKGRRPASLAQGLSLDL